MRELDILYERLRREWPGLELRQNEPMHVHTTFRVGGPVRLMLFPKTPAEASGVLGVCGQCGARPFFLGNGSNLLVADEGYDGVVISTRRLAWFDEHNTNGRDQIAALSGVPLSRLANFAAEHGLTGLEWAHGIPGSVGGAVYMNAGAYGGDMSQVVERVDYIDETGEHRALDGEDCGFSYRHSVFCEKPWLIRGAVFQMRQGDPAEIRAKMEDFAQRRREKQPLEHPSAGSTFKRPEGAFAAALIERCGLKGFAVGGAQVSAKHAGFIINTGGATCADIVTLIGQVRERVLQETGVALEPEVKYLGEERTRWNF